MQINNSVSKETLNGLIENSALKIAELYRTLKVNLAVHSLMDEHTPQLYILSQDIQNGIKFILMDISVSYKAEFSIDNPYEKRFFMKNIQASISEGYKLLFNFGKQRKKSLWKKLITKVREEGCENLINEAAEIDKKLKVFGDTKINQDLRNITLHYDKEMIEVYKKTLSVDSEDKVIQMVSEFGRLLQDILLFTDHIDDYCLKTTGMDKIYPSLSGKLEVNSKHKEVCDIINKNGELENILKNIIQKEVGNIDSTAGYWLSTKRLEEYIQRSSLTIDPFSEISNIQGLTNIQLLLKFMLLDIAAITDAYLKSSSNIEYALNLRRVCVTKVSTMVHLYGYTPDEQEHSIWNKIEKMIPADSYDLIKNADSIRIILGKIVEGTQDKDLRATFVHLFNNSKSCTDIAQVIKAIEEIDPIKQIVEILFILEIYKTLMNFTKKLMNILAQNIHKEKLQSTKFLNDKIDELICKFENSPLPDTYKTRFLSIIKEMKTKVNDLKINLHRYGRHNINT